MTDFGEDDMNLDHARSTNHGFETESALTHLNRRAGDHPRTKATEPESNSSDYALHSETDHAWAERALCKGLTEVFFGPASERPERRVEREALANSYCQACPVIDACRRYARLNHEHGFWGGENDEQRASAGFAPRSPSRRSVIAARDRAKNTERPCAESDPVRPLVVALRRSSI